ncbi:MAG: hypothetical protein KGM43_14050, partial [Planctomycetota bacterium]|nr:hypothetical protein [Planctomycetota bacterium]
MIATAICAVVVAAGAFSWNLRGAEMTSLVLIVIAATCLVSLRTRGAKCLFFWGFTLFVGIYAAVVLGNAQSRLEMADVTCALILRHDHINVPSTITTPDEFIAMAVSIHELLRVGHAWIALGVGLLGGLLCWTTLYMVEEVRNFLRNVSKAP